MNKSQKKQFEILCEVDKLCRKHKIKYFLASGTLLGAVRHKGFIPWDDDIDIDMKREDLEAFKKYALKELDKKYFYQNVDTDSYYGFMFPKIRINNTKYIEEIAIKNKAHNGIYLDIFVLDDCKYKKPKNLKRIIFTRMVLLIKNKYKIKTDTLLKKVELIIIKLYSLFVTRKRLIKKYNKLVDENRGDGYIAQYNTPYFNKIIFDKDIYEDVAEYEFEGKKFYGPKKYDKYLKYLYNDYMKLPPKEKRVTHGIIEIDYGEDE